MPIAAAAAVLLVMPGCSGSQTAQDEFCTSLTELSNQVSTLRDDVAGNLNAQELQQQAEDVRSAARAAQDKAGAASEAVRGELDQATEDFNEALSQITLATPLPEVWQQFRDAASQYADAVRGIAEEASC